MKRAITSTSLGGSALFIALSFHLDDVFLRFLVAGEVPGTELTVPPAGMLSIWAVILFGILVASLPAETRKKIPKLFLSSQQSVKSKNYKSA